MSATEKKSLSADLIQKYIQSLFIKYLDFNIMNFKLLSVLTVASMFTAAAPSISAQDVADDKGYTIEMDFEVESVSAGVIFAAKNVDNFYMWQINNQNASNPRLRPHKWTNGNAAGLDEIDLLPLGVNTADGAVHKLRMVVSDGTHADTYIDDKIVDSRDGEFEMGYLGFRQSFADGALETGIYDNIKVTKADGTVVWDVTFDEDRYFSLGEVVDGRYRVPGVFDGQHLSWSADYFNNRPHFALEADMRLMKDDVSFIFSHLDDNNYYMWAVNAFDYDEMCIRHHVFNNGNLVHNDGKFGQFSKSDILGNWHKMKFEVENSMICSYIDGVLVDHYLDYSDKLVPSAVGIRIDTRAEQNDDAYIDNIKAMVYDADGNAEEKLYETFEPGTPRWFPNVITETVDDNTMMHIFGDNALYKWMQAAEPVIEEVPEGYSLTMDFEIEHLNFGVCFGATDHNNYYMWQINNENPDAPKFRPHVWNNGNPTLIGEFDMPADVNLKDGGVHSFRIEVSKYLHADTYIDDVLIDSRDGSFPAGLVGFRQTHSDAAGTIESVFVDNIVMTSYADGKVLLSADFNDGENDFSSGEVVDGRLYVAGRMDWDHFAWSPIPGNDVWFTLEADMTLIKDDVAFIFSHIDNDNYYMWAINCFDDAGNPYPRIRRHVFSPGLVWNDNIFNQYTKEDILGTEHHVTIKVKGGFVRTYLNDDMVDQYFDQSSKLVPAFVGVRIDTKAEQQDDAYIDNIKVTEYAADGTPTVVLFDTFEPGTPRWFPDAIIESVDGNRKMHIYGDNVLYKWMQSETSFDDGTSGIEAVYTDESAPVEYYNIQGIRISGPVKGMYIERRGNKATKHFGY